MPSMVRDLVKTYLFNQLKDIMAIIPPLLESVIILKEGLLPVEYLVFLQEVNQ
jgi:hypothetical protein